VRPIVAPDPALLRMELTSKSNIRRALESVETTTPPTVAGDGMVALVEKVGQNLQVATQSTPGKNEVRVAIVCTSEDASATAVVNGLARHYADQCRTKLQADAHQALAAARAAHQRARQQALAAQGAVDDYLRGGLRQAVPAGDDSPPSDGAPRQIPAAVGSPPDLEASPRSIGAGRELRLTINPEWSRLHDELQSLRSRRTQLLAVRTPAHPEIQDLETRIAQTEERLAATRRQIVDRPADLPVVVNGALPSQPARPIAAVNEDRAGAQRSGEMAGENAKASAEYRTLNEALARANADVERLAAAERQTRQEQEQLPLIEVFEAQVAPATSSRLAALRQPLRASLAAGLAMAIGVGLMLRGIPRARTFATAAQLHNTLSLPVVGMLHEAGVAVLGGSSVLRFAASLLCLMLGATIVGGCGLVFTGQVDHLASYVPYDLHSVIGPLHRFVDILTQKP
jgi:hypothetical protein